MARKKKIAQAETVPLKLTAAERKLVLEELVCIDKKFEHAVRNTPTHQPVMLTRDDLDDFADHIAAEANHCEDPATKKKFDKICQKIETLLDKSTNPSPRQSVKVMDAKAAQGASEKAVQIAEWAAKALIAAEHLGITKKPIDHFWLSPAHREVLLLVPGVSKAIKGKLSKNGTNFSVAEVAGMTMALAEDFVHDDARKQVAVLIVVKHLMDQMQDWIAGPAIPAKGTEPKAKTATSALLQFKITLLGIEPAIWRRIQIQDCMLDRLHEYIQTAMGWTNSHLHQFEIKGKCYGDPELLDDGFEDFHCVDSTRTMVSRIVPKTGKRFAFNYEYDFGDGWKHEILFEGFPPLEAGKKYPRCVEGERACPPEDVGGIFGYQDFLAAIANPKHKEHRSFLRWCGGKFSPNQFDPVKATKDMLKGLPDWRRTM